MSLWTNTVIDFNTAASGRAAHDVAARATGLAAYAGGARPEAVDRPPYQRAPAPSGSHFGELASLGQYAPGAPAPDPVFRPAGPGDPVSRRYYTSTRLQGCPTLDSAHEVAAAVRESIEHLLADQPARDGPRYLLLGEQHLCGLAAMLIAGARNHLPAGSRHCYELDLRRMSEGIELAERDFAPDGAYLSSEPLRHRLQERLSAEMPVHRANRRQGLLNLVNMRDDGEWPIPVDEGRAHACERYGNARSGAAVALRERVMLALLEAVSARVVVCQVGAGHCSNLAAKLREKGYAVRSLELSLRPRGADGDYVAAMIGANASAGTGHRVFFWNPSVSWTSAAGLCAAIPPPAAPGHRAAMEPDRPAGCCALN